MMKAGIIKVMFFCIIQTGLFSTVWGQEVSSVIQYQNDLLKINAQRTPLGTILKEIQAKCSITISGIQHREKELITFSSTGNPEEVLKRLFNQLKEKNAAYQYNRIGLSKVTIMPEGKQPAYIPPATDYAAQEIPPPPVAPMPIPENVNIPPEPHPPQIPIPENANVAQGIPPIPHPAPWNENVPQVNPVIQTSENAAQQDSAETAAQSIPPTAVQISNVNDGTQGQAAGLRPGDMILEYDGIRVSDTQQLVEEVKNRSNKETVDMVVMRNNQPTRVSLKGGTIGIHINNVNVPK